MPSNSTEAYVRGKWDAWARMCGLPLNLAGERFENLRDLYGEPHRHYHNLDHIADLLRRCEGVRCGSAHAIIGTVFYHNAIYEVGAADNEARSAALAVADLEHMGAAKLGHRLAPMIEATAAHEATDDAATDIVIDIDMAILGDDPLAYERYRENVMAEYLTVYSEEQYRAGRVALFIDPMLARERIFLGCSLEDREAQARANLKAERVWLQTS